MVRHRQFKTPDFVTVTTSYTTIIEVWPEGQADVVNAEVESAAASAAALSSFKMQLKDHKDGEWYDFLTDAEFEAVDKKAMLFCSPTDPDDLAAGEKSHIQVLVRAAYGARFQAKVAASTAKIAIRGGLKANA